MSKKALKKVMSKAYKRAKLLLHYSKKTSFKKNTQNKRIIVCFDGLFPHGGLVDRLKGIVSFYEISKILGYDFYIQFDNPFRLDAFLEPNVVRWQINKADIKFHPTQTKLLYVVNDFDCNPIEIIKQSNAKTFIVYANIDYFNRFYSLETPKAIEAKWRTSFNELFKKSEELQTKLNSVENEKYVAFHTRFTSLMGDFVDSSVKIISEEQKQNLLNKLQVKVKNIIDKEPFKCYGFSDSVRFLNYIKANETVNLVEGNPFHMDNYQGGSTLNSHLKTLLDFFMIANSEAVYFLKIEPMYHSSFSKYAAIIGDKPFTVISDT